MNEDQILSLQDFAPDPIPILKPFVSVQAVRACRLHVVVVVVVVVVDYVLICFCRLVVFVKIG
jgi:hypothetical protein